MPIPNPLPNPLPAIGNEVGGLAGGLAKDSATTALDAIGDDQLTRTDKLVLAAVDGARTVNEVIKESPVGSFYAIKAVYQFLQSRVLRPRTA